MAPKASTKAAVLEADEVEETETAEPTTKQLINEGIVAVIEATGIDVQKNRYKAMRAIAFQAFSEAIESGEFDALVERAIANIDDLPAGWEIERAAKDESPAKPAKATPATKATPAKRPARASTKAPAASTRKRPAR